MTFSKEVEMATAYLLNMVYKHRYGVGTQDQQAPQWCNFDFFSEIRPSKVNHVRRLVPGDSGSYGCYGWWLSRTVEFFYKDRLVAVVNLQGMRPDRKRYDDPTGMWAISKVYYASRFDGHEPQDWIDRLIPITSYQSERPSRKSAA